MHCMHRLLDIIFTIHGSIKNKPNVTYMHPRNNQTNDTFRVQACGIQPTTGTPVKMALKVRVIRENSQVENDLQYGTFRYIIDIVRSTSQTMKNQQTGGTMQPPEYLYDWQQYQGYLSAAYRDCLSGHPFKTYKALLLK